MAAPACAHDALVLGALDYGERDRIVRLLTPELGRVSALARGARGSSRRFAGSIDIGNRIQALLRPGRGELWHLQEAELMSARLHTRDDLVAMGMGAYGCELVGALAREHHPEPHLFGLLEVFLTVLDAATATPAGLFRAGLEVKALNLAGLAPVLDRCVRCGQPLAEPCAFSADGGGGMHAGCGAGEPVSLVFLQSLEHARRTRLIELLDQEMPEGPPWILARFAEHHLGRGLKSRKWLETIG